LCTKTAFRERSLKVLFELKKIIQAQQAQIAKLEVRLERYFCPTCNKEVQCLNPVLQPETGLSQIFAEGGFMQAGLI
jgi:hypothetical protein